MKRILAVAFVMLVSLTTLGCGNPPVTRTSAPSTSESAILTNRLSEVAPPETIQALRGALEIYQPQVKILSPRANEVIQSDRISVRFQVKDLPLFKDEELGLGPHLHVFLDNQPYQAVYNANEPLVFEDLTPGTHTIRAFASRPWHESFKNEGAFAQTTFHIYTKTPDNQPDPTQPLLTYSRPQGSYGAEPILLDFYLTNAPLHLIAQERSDDDIRDWKVRCTVNGQSFTFNAWDAIYLKGFKTGKNWVQLELLDENNNPFNNTFNNTARIVTYEPGGDDTLSQLVRGELSEAEARGIIDPNYVYVPEAPAPEPTPEEAPEAAEREPKITDSVKSTEQEDVAEPEAGVTDDVSSPTEQQEPSEPQPEASPEPLPSPEPVPSPVAEPTEPSAFPVDEPLTEPADEQDKTELQEPGAITPTASQSEPSEEIPAAEQAPEPTEETGSGSDAIAPSSEPATPKRGFFDRFRQRFTPSPTPTPVLSPEPVTPELVAPSPEASVEVVPEPATEKGQVESDVEEAVPVSPATPNPELPDFEELLPTSGSTFEEIPAESPVVEPGEPESMQPEPRVSSPNEAESTPDESERPSADSSKRSPVQTFFNRFRRSAPTRPVAPGRRSVAPPSVPPAPSEIPEVIEIPEPATEVPDAVTPNVDTPAEADTEN
ncbi:hypothetical protein H6G89_16030 [Oscillatoria sp. FACHB-1407]|uniref:hypothetical protein n=1 Tax=Oscillatoria sp. FACHB-1407 TaxID=2692847 RepID=UPI00168406A0|nr:hypothetical protein [Oscillatoria sp. FACHB-1407]MBD2462554.1 hypothetical protein [Oscillatoria sp. FACHB-1407]